MKRRYIGLLLFICLIFNALSVFGALGVSADTLDYGETTISEADVQHVYDKLKEGVEKSVPDEKITFDTQKSISKDEMERGISLFIGDHPECFWFRNHYRYFSGGDKVLSITPEYAFEGAALIEAKNELDNVVGGIMKGLPEGSNYDKALYLHDTLANIVEYELVGEHQTAYGALVSGKAVCAGYAAAYQLLLEEAGITAWTVTGVSQKPGSSEQIPHAWNVVWLDADTCVYTDVTWDDQGEDLYHYYFNLSRSEMEADHVVDANKFALPACDHDSSSYFDVNGGVMNDSSTVESLVPLFAAAIGNGRSARVCFTGSDFRGWMTENGYALYKALGGLGNSPSYSYRTLGKEIHLTVTGSYPKATYKVSVSLGINMSIYSDAEQYVEIGEEMTPIIVSADKGYYFPEGYSVTSVGGIGVTRIDSRHISVTGTPTLDNIILNIPAPTKMTLEETPSAIFTATSDSTGILSSVAKGMKYSTDLENWTDINSSADIALEGLKEGSLYVIRKGNGESTYDSSVQTVEITRAKEPTLNVTQPAAPLEKGSINTTNAHEYSTDLKNWIACTGRLDGLEAGRYYVRVRANGNALASVTVELEVEAYTAPQPEDPNDPEQGESDDKNGDGNVTDVLPPNGTDSENGSVGDEGGENNVADKTDKDVTDKGTTDEDGNYENGDSVTGPAILNCRMALGGEGAVMAMLLCLALVGLRAKKKSKI